MSGPGNMISFYIKGGKNKKGENKNKYILGYMVETVLEWTKGVV